MSARPPRLLIVSPIASHPVDQGNAARIQALGAALMARGVVCEFLYYATEGLAPDQRAAMAGFWHALHVEPPVPVAPMSHPGVWGIDDWCAPALVERVAALQRAWRYDAVLVNYVWLSAVLEAVPGALRILDTHDLFGGRHLAAQAEGLDPSWFFTTAAEEGRGLDRAELVLAIQAAEAVALRERTARPVEVLGHMPPLRFLTAPEAGPPRHRFGYLGSANPWNAGSVRALDRILAAAAQHDPAAPRLDWLLAGRILRRTDLELASHPALLPELADPAAFYDAVDCVVNPMRGGTGLKIKTVEALAYGRPVLGTRDAFAGLPAEHPGHAAEDVPALAGLMQRYAAEPGYRHALRRASRLLALRYAAEVAAAQDALVARLRALV